MHEKKNKSRITLFIGIALILGIIAGFILNKSYVGNENTQIANADRQLKIIAGNMKVYEQPSDTTLNKALSERKLNLQLDILAAEKKLLDQDLVPTIPSIVLSLKDSLKKTELTLGALTDTTNPAYKQFDKPRTVA